MILKACCFFPRSLKRYIYDTRLGVGIFRCTWSLKESLLFVSKCVNVNGSGIGLLDMFGGLVSRYCTTAVGVEREGATRPLQRGLAEGKMGGGRAI